MVGNPRYAIELLIILQPQRFINVTKHQYKVVKINKTKVSLLRGNVFNLWYKMLLHYKLTAWAWSSSSDASWHCIWNRQYRKIIMFLHVYTSYHGQAPCIHHTWIYILTNNLKNLSGTKKLCCMKLILYLVVIALD